MKSNETMLSASSLGDDALAEDLELSPPCFVVIAETGNSPGHSRVARLHLMPLGIS
jgi:hypothetical protein